MISFVHLFHGLSILVYNGDDQKKTLDVCTPFSLHDIFGVQAPWLKKRS
jgi:hypothetical protein